MQLNNTMPAYRAVVSSRQQLAIGIAPFSSSMNGSHTVPCALGQAAQPHDRRGAGPIDEASEQALIAQKPLLTFAGHFFTAFLPS